MLTGEKYLREMKCVLKATNPPSQLYSLTPNDAAELEGGGRCDCLIWIRKQLFPYQG